MQGEEHPSVCMLNKAIQELRDFIHERSCVFVEVGYDGREVATGWGKVDTYRRTSVETHAGQSQDGPHH